MLHVAFSIAVLNLSHTVTAPPAQASQKDMLMEEKFLTTYRGAIVGEGKKAGGWGGTCLQAFSCRILALVQTKQLVLCASEFESFRQNLVQSYLIIQLHCSLLQFDCTEFLTDT